MLLCICAQGFGSTHYEDWRGPDGKRYGERNVIKKVRHRLAALLVLETWQGVAPSCACRLTQQPVGWLLPCMLRPNSKLHRQGWWHTMHGG
jgi:hypothetical protein